VRAGELPTIAFGCSPPRRGLPADLDELQRAMAAALDLGYRLFDTAEAYGTEPLLGALLRERRGRGAAVVSKLWHTNHAPEHVRPACEASLRRLSRDCLDVYLVHAPEAWAYRGPLEIVPGSREEVGRQLEPRGADGPPERAAVALEETWAAMAALREAGLVRSIGLCNVGVAELERVARACLERPAVVQVEAHPLRPAKDLVDYCQKRGIAVMAHTPLGGGGVLAHPRLRELAAERGVSPAHLVLSWHRARGVLPVVGSRDPAHLREDARACGEPLPAALVAAVGSLAA
jgi:alcohol dehydrogenase (NADP+)